MYVLFILIFYILLPSRKYFTLHTDFVDSLYIRGYCMWK